MKSTIILALIAVALTGCATVNDSIQPNAKYVIAPKGDDAEYSRDVDQCKHETNQRHRVKDSQALPLQAECLLNKGHRLVLK